MDLSSDAGVLSRCYPLIKRYRLTNKVKRAKNRKSPDAARHSFMRQDCFCFFDTSIITAHKLHCCAWQARVDLGREFRGSVAHRRVCTVSRRTPAD